MDSINEKKILPFMKQIVQLCQKVTDKQQLSKQEILEFKTLSSLIDGFFRLTNCNINSIDDILGKEIKTTSSFSQAGGDGARPTAPPVQAGPPPKPKHPEYDSATDVEFSDSDSDIDDDTEQRKIDTLKNHELIKLGIKRAKHVMSKMVFPITMDSDSEKDEDNDTGCDVTSSDGSSVPKLVSLDSTNDDRGKYQLTTYVPPQLPSICG